MDSKDLQQRWQKLVRAGKAWPVPGMADVDGRRVLTGSLDGDMHLLWSKQSGAYLVPVRGFWPDFADAATLGCIQHVLVPKAYDGAEVDVFKPSMGAAIVGISHPEHIYRTARLRCTSFAGALIATLEASLSFPDKC